MKKKLYKYLPVFFQNIAISIANIFVLNKKFGYIPIINPLNRISKKVLSENLNIDEKKLTNEINKLLKYAKNHVNFYKRNSNKYIQISSLNEINKIPVLNKFYLKNNIKDFYSDDINWFNSKTLYTSGTTGTPMKIKVRTKDLRHRFKLLLKVMLENGFDPSKPVAKITGQDICDDEIIYRQDYFNKHFFLSAFHISQKNIYKYFNVIKENKIETIEGYPSAIYILAKLLKENNLKIDCVKQVFTTAEKLHSYQKILIENVFNCKVYDYYGSNDQSVLIYTCKEGKMHVANATGLLEVLDKNNKNVKFGETGFMIVTSLTSYFMPLIRYKIGDLCVVARNQNCNCGNKGLIIEEIIGRDEDIFKTNDGRYITRFSVVLKYLPEKIIESQLVLSNSNNNVKLYYIANENIDLNLFKEFEEKLLEKIGKNYTVTYHKVKKINSTKSGKKKAIKIEN